MSPDEASAFEDKDAIKLWHNLYDKWTIKQPKNVVSPYRVGDFVRQSLLKGPFAKQRTQGWTNEIFQVVGDVYKNVYAERARSSRPHLKRNCSACTR